MKFIRRNGRIIPIGMKNDALIVQKKITAGAKQAGKNVAQNAANKALDAGNDAYNSNLNDKQKMAVKSGMSIFEKAFAAGTVAAAARSLIGAGDKAAGDYQKQAKDARAKYASAAAGGAAIGIGGAGAIARGDRLAKAAKPFLKYGSMTSLKMGSKLVKAGNAWKIGGAVGSVAGIASLGVGIYGAKKASDHEKRANKIRSLTSTLKKYSGG